MRGLNEGDVMGFRGPYGNHFPLEEMAGKSLVEQHQMVYRALGDKMKQEIHALSLRTFTRAAWAQR